MIGTFALVTLQSFRNRMMSKIRRLRQPRYLAGALAGAAYFYFVVLQRASHNAKAGQLLRRFGLSDLRIDMVAVGVLLFAILVWALPSDEGGLEFTEAEIAFLFPAPLRRAQILLYKVIRSQPQVLITCTIATLLGARRGWFVGIWAAFTMAQLYMTMAALGRARLRLAGFGLLARLATVIGLLALLTWYGWFHFGAVFHQVARYSDLPFAEIEPAFHTGAARWLLFVPRFFATAVFPGSIAALALSVVSLLLLGGVFFLVAARLNVSFEEASIAATQKRLARVESMQGRRSGRNVTFKRMPAPKLRPTGPVEVAIIWKNVVALLRISSAWLMVFLAIYLFLLGEAAWFHRDGATTGIGVTMACFAAIFVFVGPAIFANDLRLDFSRLEVLKSYPISGERLVAAEIAAPLCVVSFLELLFLITAAALLTGAGGSDRLSLLVTAQSTTVALLVAIPICALQLAIRNSVPVLFPAWAGRSKEDPRGIAFTGQRILMVAGNLLVLAIALIPAGLVLLPSLWISMKWFAGHPAAVAIASMPAVFTLSLEVWLVVKALGVQFDRLDVSNEIDIVEFA